MKVGLLQTSQDEILRRHEVAQQIEQAGLLPKDYGVKILASRATTKNKAEAIIEHIDGERLSDGMWSPEELDEIELKIIEVYQLLNDHSLYNMDMNPDNIIVSRTGNGIRIHVIDMRLAPEGRRDLAMGQDDIVLMMLPIRDARFQGGQEAKFDENLIDDDYLMEILEQLEDEQGSNDDAPPPAIGFGAQSEGAPNSQVNGLKRILRKLFDQPEPGPWSGEQMVEAIHKRMRPLTIPIWTAQRMTQWADAINHHYGHLPGPIRAEIAYALARAEVSLGGKVYVTLPDMNIVSENGQLTILALPRPGAHVDNYMDPSRSSLEEGIGTWTNGSLKSARFYLNNTRTAIAALDIEWLMSHGGMPFYSERPPTKDALYWTMPGIMRLPVERMER